MKKLVLFPLFFLFSLLFVSSGMSAHAHNDSADFRGVWVSTVLNLDYPLQRSRDPAILKAQADEILNHAADMGFNAVILQVRPTADALYDSALFPWSHYLTGAAGTAPDGGFDPLEYWVTGAHERGLELHAWLNPFRITKNTTLESVTSPQALPQGHPAREHPEWVVLHSDGNLYFDPGIPQVRELIVAGAVEIVEHYDVDGIHLDDYFYPDESFKDDETFVRYGSDYTDRNDWRRANVDALVQSLYQTLHAVEPGISFGISPFGIWANDTTKPEGSHTSGGESYSQHFADTRKWVQEGWLDYIAPQIYWHIGHKAADYATLLQWWDDVVDGTGVALYIGQAAYRVGESEDWPDAGQLSAQLALNAQAKNVRGSIFFRYGSVISDAVRTALRQQWTPVPASGSTVLSVSRPAARITTAFDTYCILGVCDSELPLWCNGIDITDCIRGTFFCVTVPLEQGTNRFLFSQGKQTAICSIYRTTEPFETASTPELSDVYPGSDLYAAAGETVTVSCTAPIGACVRAMIGGTAYPMQADVWMTPDASQICTTRYTLEYTIPENDGNIPVSIQMIAYSHKEETAPVNICMSPENTGLLGVICTDYAPAAQIPEELSTTSLTLRRGMTDTVCAFQGTLAQLSCGLWVSTGDLEIVPEEATDHTGHAQYRTEGSNIHEVFIACQGGLAWADYDGARLVLTLAGISLQEAPALTMDGVFSTMQMETQGSNTVLTFYIRDSFSLSGYEIIRSDTGITLHLRTKRSALPGVYPLQAHIILLDPGHGGTQAGALGFAGATIPESDINFAVTRLLQEKLESLGATVYLTRAADETRTLAQRLAMCRELQPDLFVSVHANSMPENIDMADVQGFSVYYRQNVSANAAQQLYAGLQQQLGSPDTGLHQKNFHVCRANICPAILLETGFMTNPAEFSQLSCFSGQNRIAQAAAEAILAYFSS